MYSLERQKEILELLTERKSISVKEISSLLYISEPTVRRDLTLLQEQGKVQRTHGGAVLRMVADAEIPLVFREDKNSLAKKLIAEKAVKYIKDGLVIFLDASSTAAALVPYFSKFSDLTVITNSPKTSMKLGEKGIKNYCTGGLLLPHSVAFVGSETERFIGGINADICFFSSRGYEEGGFITDSSESEVAVRRAMLKNSMHSFYLADSSKKNKKYAFNIAKITDVTGVITE
ncbi:MAG: DeoR/GlpR transcriptional regulator [Clostridia bacterium]|nr:DeoR/GlpR transcriptional regulator [Clostridia bacterium]